MRQWRTIRNARRVPTINQSEQSEQSDNSASSFSIASCQRASAPQVTRPRAHNSPTNQFHSPPHPTLNSSLSTLNFPIPAPSIATSRNAPLHTSRFFGLICVGKGESLSHRHAGKFPADGEEQSSPSSSCFSPASGVLRSSHPSQPSTHPRRVRSLDFRSHSNPPIGRLPPLRYTATIPAPTDP